MGDISTNNLAIAIFLGGVYKKEHNTVHFENDKTTMSVYCSITDLRYHKDWNHLMQAVKKITVEELDGYNIKRNSLRDWSFAIGDLNKALFDADIEKVYSTVVYIIKNLEMWKEKNQI